MGYSWDKPGKINKSCKNGGCCFGCDDKYRGFGAVCQKQCDHDCSNCSSKDDSTEPKTHDGGWND